MNGHPLPLQSGDQNGTSRGCSEQEAGCLKSVVELQEKINQQLNSMNHSSTMDGLLSPVCLPYDKNPHLVTPLQPPQHCIASPSEQLLDIIIHSSCVKQHEHEIQAIDTYKLNQTVTPSPLQDVLNSQILVSPLPAAHRPKQPPLVLPNLPYTDDINRGKVMENGLSLLIRKRNGQELNQQNSVHVSNMSGSQPLTCVRTRKEGSTTSPNAPHSNTTPNNPCIWEEKISISAHVPICTLPFTKASQDSPSIASLKTSDTSSLSSHTHSERGQPLSAAGQSASEVAVENGVLNTTDMVYPAQPPMVYNPQSLVVAAPNQSQYCLSLSPLAGLSPVQMLFVTPVTTLVPQVPLALNNSMNLTSPAAVGNANQSMYCVSTHGFLSPQGQPDPDKAVKTDPISLTTHNNYSRIDNLRKTNGLTHTPIAKSAIKQAIPASLEMSMPTQQDLLPTPVKRAKFQSPSNEPDPDTHFRSALVNMYMEAAVRKTNMFLHNDMKRTNSSLKSDVNGSRVFPEDISEEQLVLEEGALDEDSDQIATSPSAANTYMSTSELYNCYCHSCHSPVLSVQCLQY